MMIGSISWYLIIIISLNIWFTLQRLVKLLYIIDRPSKIGFRPVAYGSPFDKWRVLFRFKISRSFLPFRLGIYIGQGYSNAVETKKTVFFCSLPWQTAAIELMWITEWQFDWLGRRIISTGALWFIVVHSQSAVAAPATHCSLTQI